MEAEAEQRPGRRRYDSPLRRAQAESTRGAVLSAATALFEQRGWAATSMREVARNAGVSVETVYAGFGSKAELLRQALDVAIAGDDQPVAVMGRPEFAALGEGDLESRLAAGAALVTEANRRTAGLISTLREAARSEPDLAERLAQSRRQHRDTARAGASLMAGRELTDTQADALWALVSAEVYELLTGAAGWDEGKYRTWVGGVLGQVLGAPSPDEERARP